MEPLKAFYQLNHDGVLKEALLTHDDHFLVEGNNKFWGNVLQGFPRI